MFSNIPCEIELYIWTLYFKSEVVPEILLVGIERSTKRIYKSLLPTIIDYSVKEKATRIINSIVSREIVADLTNIRSLDDMYYNLINIHYTDMYDIFEL